MGGLGYVRITQPEFNNTVLDDGAVALTPYFVQPSDDGVLVPATFAAGVHVLNLMGMHPGQPPLYDGQHLYVCDPFGAVSAANILRVTGRAGGVGSKIAMGAAAVDSTDLILPGITALFIFSSATNTWNLYSSTAGGAGGDPGDLQLAGDLLGTGSTAAVPRIGTLTGVAGTLALATTAAILQWVPNVATPTIKQATTAAAAGSVTLLSGQDSSHVAGVGGLLALSSGAGFNAANAGKLELRTGGTARVVLSPTSANIPTIPLTFGDSSTGDKTPATDGMLRMPAADSAGAQTYTLLGLRDPAGVTRQVIGVVGAVGQITFGAAGQTGVLTGSSVVLNAQVSTALQIAGANVAAVDGAGVHFAAALAIASVNFADAGNVAAAPLVVNAQNGVGGASVGGDLQIGGGTGNTAGFVDFRNQALSNAATTIGGGQILTGLFAQFVPIKVGGVAMKMVVLAT